MRVRATGGPIAFLRFVQFASLTSQRKAGIFTSEQSKARITKEFELECDVKWITNLLLHLMLDLETETTGNFVLAFLTHKRRMKGK